MRLLILRTADEMGYINEKRKYLSVFSRSNICIMMQSYYADAGHFYSIVLKSIVEEAKILGYSSIMHYFEDANMDLSLIHISEPTRQAEISYAVFCLKKKKKKPIKIFQDLIKQQLQKNK